MNEWLNAISSEACRTEEVKQTDWWNELFGKVNLFYIIFLLFFQLFFYFLLFFRLIHLIQKQLEKLFVIEIHHFQEVLFQVNLT